MSAQQTRGRRDDDLSGSLASSLRDFMRTEAGSAGLLLVAAVAALVWANLRWSSSYEALWHKTLSIAVNGLGLSMDLHHWVNDGLMAVFFFVIGLEVRREFSVGELTDRRRTVVPLVAGIGGMVVPAALYLWVDHTGDLAQGWGIVIGTDTAFLLGMLALVGPAVSTQPRIFLLTLTVIDDIAAVSVIGIAYTDHVSITPLVVAVLALAGIAVLDRFTVRLAGPYATLAVIAWLAMLDSGLHASIAGMLAGLLVPATEPTRAHLDAAATQFRAFGLGQRNAALQTALAEPVDPARDHVLGEPDAEITLVEYLDFECPFCARAQAIVREVRGHFGPRLRYVARHLPLSRHPHAELAAVAAEAAGRQGSFWVMHDHLFAHQDHLEFEDLAAYASALGLDAEHFLDDLEDPALAARVREDMASAEASGVRSTPTFFVGHTRVEGRYDARTLVAALEQSGARTIVRPGS